jgi:hypothetical protein
MYMKNSEPRVAWDGMQCHIEFFIHICMEKLTAHNIQWKCDLNMKRTWEQNSSVFLIKM